MRRIRAVTRWVPLLTTCPTPACMKPPRIRGQSSSMRWNCSPATTRWKSVKSATTPPRRHCLVCSFVSMTPRRKSPISRQVTSLSHGRSVGVAGGTPPESGTLVTREADGLLNSITELDINPRGVFLPTHPAFYFLSWIGDLWQLNSFCGSKNIAHKR